MNQYLVSSTIINWQNPTVLEQAEKLSFQKNSPTEIAKACFEFVRDDITHCIDSDTNIVTLTASEVLEYKTGYCYAKSHLLAALLRANNIPAGLCYQRLTIEDFPAPDAQLTYSLHGLNAVYLDKFGWYRIDARGNKPRVNAQFSPPDEQLAFTLKTPGEASFPEIYNEPLPEITHVLSQYTSIYDVQNNLPDITP